ncbi:MAG: NAD(P)-dependent oxidoreductase [Pseudomonadota bacterium]
MDKVFIAGGTGMLGAATARELAHHGIQVIVSSRKASDPTGAALEAESDLIRMVRLDLQDGPAVRTLFEQERFDGLVMVVHTHQYAQTRDVNNQIYPITLNCLEAARTCGVARVIVGGSMAVYGGMIPPLTEDRAFPAEVVAASDADEGVMKKFEVATKRALEILTLDYATPFQMGLSIPPGTVNPEPHAPEIAILRAPMMFGPGYAAIGSPLGIAAHVVAGRLPRFKGHPGYGHAPVEALWAVLAPIPVNYVKDNATCIRIALTAPRLPHRIYNIDSGFPRSPRAQLQAVLAVAPDSVDRFGLSPEELPETSPDLGFSGTRFAQDFGWAGQHTLETALGDYVDWLRTYPI